MWSTVVGRVWSRSGVGYGVGKGLKYGGGRIGGGGGVVPVRSLSVEPLREGVKSLMNKAMIYTGLKEPALKVRPPQFFNLGCKMPRSSFWRTKYNLRHRMYTKALLSKAKIRRGRIGRYRGLRRRLRREVTLLGFTFKKFLVGQSLFACVLLRGGVLFGKESVMRKREDGHKVFFFWRGYLKGTLRGVENVCCFLVTFFGGDMLLRHVLLMNR